MREGDAMAEEGKKEGRGNFEPFAKGESKMREERRGNNVGSTFRKQEISELIFHYCSSSPSYLCRLNRKEELGQDPKLLHTVVLSTWKGKRGGGKENIISLKSPDLTSPFSA